ncbi:DUF2326 domain-containing protein [Actinocatenispora rupis]|uniref:DUF2326 domain-containing protein n=1 Tax=Actinocatenispora rupis TaxID=519421 RepID=A0A8J3J6W1_9ACTN|nr:DUF2326 domain-containing protein [Actinocatenispora rupis]GID13120.1 hypothetical protein Aru02nite_40090 [Actinocatenispora rupis]
MLRELASDLPGFRPVRFAPGLNVAVVDDTGENPVGSPGPRHALPEIEQSVIPIKPNARIGFTPLGEQWARERERAAEAAADESGRHTSRRTRLVCALDFALGSTGLPRHPGRRQELTESTTTVRLTGAGETVTATRAGATPARLTVHSSGTDAAPWALPLDEWRGWLGRTLFGLTDAEDEPSYRSLMGYYVRDADHGGMSDPIRHHARQPTVESLPPLAHLFGLDPALVEAAKTLHQSRRHLRTSQRGDGDLPSGQRLSDPSASRDLANLTAEIATLELERAEAAAAASWRSTRVAGGGLATDPALATATLDARLAELMARRAALARYADAHAELQRQALELRDSVRSDLRGRHDRLTAASALFTRFAYEMFGPGRPAALTVAARDSGYAFYPVLGGDPGPGVPGMTLFCFDLAMAVTAHRAGTGPDFLVHDSALYERIPTEFAAAALDLAARTCAAEDMQYVAVVDRAQLTAVTRYDPALSYHECAVLAET